MDQRGSTAQTSRRGNEAVLALNLREPDDAEGHVGLARVTRDPAGTRPEQNTTMTTMSAEKTRGDPGGFIVGGEGVVDVGGAGADGVGGEDGGVAEALGGQGSKCRLARRGVGEAGGSDATEGGVGGGHGQISMVCRVGEQAQEAAVRSNFIFLHTASIDGQDALAGRTVYYVTFHSETWL